MIDLKHKTILVTGASSGIGRATAILCDKMGAALILTGRNKNELLKTQSQLKNKSEIIVADLSIEKEIENVISQLPNIDGMAHCAGIIKPMPVKFLRSKHIAEIFDINFSSAVLLCSYLLTAKKLNTGASVVFVSSVSSHHPYTGGALYSASKAALEAFCKSFALENAGKKIRANIVSPALVKTNLLEEAAKSYLPEELENVKQKYPLGLGEPDDVANAIVFFLSPACKWVTGSNLLMDGGLLLNGIK